RPENIRSHATHPERPNVVTGVVEKVEFLGQILACQVRVGPRLVNVLQNPRTQPAVGDQVYLELAPDVCTILAEDQAAS
ncbi:MAG: TOBE domain-containing protein, partial [Betaproteobacteria bacterium]